MCITGEQTCFHSISYRSGESNLFTFAIIDFIFNLLWDFARNRNEISTELRVLTLIDENIVTLRSRNLNKMI